MVVESRESADRGATAFAGRAPVSRGPGAPREKASPRDDDTVESSGFLPRQLASSSNIKNDLASKPRDREIPTGRPRVRLAYDGQPDVSAACSASRIEPNGYLKQAEHSIADALTVVMYVVALREFMASP
jgi:hypothetical protein